MSILVVLLLYNNETNFNVLHITFIKHGFFLQVADQNKIFVPKIQLCACWHPMKYWDIDEGLPTL